MQIKYCKIADEKCYECISGTYLGKDNKCSLSKNCLESDKGICIQCLDNYHLDLENKCTNIDKCIYIDYTSNFFETCLECEDNYYYNITSRKCEKEYEYFENVKYLIKIFVKYVKIIFI